MSFIRTILVLESLAISTWAQPSSSSFIDPAPFNAQSTSGFATLATPIALATPGTLAPESQCLGNSSLTSFCPSCDGSVIPSGLFGAYDVVCNKLFTNVRYYEYIHRASVMQCIHACREFKGCYSPVVSPEWKCFLAIEKPHERPALTQADGYAALLARFTGAIPPSSSSLSGFESYASTTTSKPSSSGVSAASTMSSLTSLSSSAPATTQISKTSWTSSSTSASFLAPSPDQCNLSEVYCPKCDNVQIRDGLNDTYCVKCDLLPTCEIMYGRNECDSPNLCMEQCDKDPECSAAVFEGGYCVICHGAVESWTRYPLPDDYVVFVRDSALNDAISIMTFPVSATSESSLTFPAMARTPGSLVRTSGSVTVISSVATKSS